MKWQVPKLEVPYDTSLQIIFWNIDFVQHLGSRSKSSKFNMWAWKMIERIGRGEVAALGRNQREREILARVWKDS